MGERYYITGVQIGIIKSFADMENYIEVNRLLRGIELRQFIGEKKDFERMLKEFKKKKIQKIVK